MDQQRFNGVVKWFNNAKGFGFIGKSKESEEWPVPNDADIFVHYTAIQNAGFKKLNEGDFVEFSAAEGTRNRMQAEQVKVINAATTKKQST